ncbi:Alpha/Beta hydrolase protein [Lentinula edodes]|uniref:Alpha/Beta hydrolase protein n=1 Tax=Lentinula lateritia TaxID=40482 RepID=A0A9W8ZXC8_9AGAR|nr:Alpha/Beta hydrolase protein [Lentinula edodes]
MHLYIGSGVLYNGPCTSQDLLILSHPTCLLPKGNTKFKYTISTPKSEEAEQIDAGLPTIVFFHPVFLAEHIFQAQFSDRRLRQYNLVSFDCRGHGKTTGDPVLDWYGHVEAAEDAIQLMAFLQNSLNLPPCHLVGVSSATNTIFEVAVMEPERVLSMFLVSPVCLEVPTEVAEGHHKIKDLWTSAFPDNKTVLKDLIYDAEFGEKQFLFSEPQLSSLSSADTPKFWLDVYAVNCDIFTYRFVSRGL